MLKLTDRDGIGVLAAAEGPELLVPGQRGRFTCRLQRCAFRPEHLTIAQASDFTVEDIAIIRDPSEHTDHNGLVIERTDAGEYITQLAPLGPIPGDVFDSCSPAGDFVTVAAAVGDLVSVDVTYQGGASGGVFEATFAGTCAP